jgi:tripeptide aminopeptidase
VIKHENRRLFMEENIRQSLLKRFLDYVKIDSTSNKNGTNRPTTQGQWEFAEKLKKELKELGIKKINLTKNCFLIASLDSNLTDRKKAEKVPTIGLMAHLDTSSDVPGRNVKPVIHENYDGKMITLKNNQVLLPEDNPALKNYINTTIITSDGTSLLGADDKAGIAEIMTALEYLINHPEMSHGPLEIFFTSDEETGFGMDSFPYDSISSKYCYTIDGGEDGVIESECFNAYKVEVDIKGTAAHLGEARGKLNNAVEIASQLISNLPKEESPQATDSYYGYYAPVEINGNFTQTEVKILIRDFNDTEVIRRIKAVKAIVKSLKLLHPKSNIQIHVTKQYSNMKKYLDSYPESLKKLEKAVRMAGIEPVHKNIRGGTDGARLSASGIPTPNLFSGGYNFHSFTEWASLEAMLRATKTIINLIRLWAEVNG